MTSVPGSSDPQAPVDDLVACPGCDLLHHRRHLLIGELARCERCGDILQSNKFDSVDRTLAAVLASIVLLLVSLCLPFLSLSRAGINSTISVLDAVSSLWFSDMLWLGTLTLAFIVLLPLTRLLLLAWVLGRIRFQRKIRRGMRMAFRWSIRMEPWAMADIFMVGVVVSLVKVSTLANLHTGLAFWSLLLLVGLSIFINLTLCKDTIWAVLTYKD
ncbi:paraquat-inducible protein A [Granulosicoccus antarcticus]|uniref:Paraquat-inducible protein A n=1 Tax=Granulosicoccus antarcticus IMCC3135 TaxID=1192854 RepID=A0A2Z2NJ43_9GAMM|nr:paraquat-inducible protein A [Granulosicoccus antarcticus]ASJ71376.1 Paraquat-inducible protein A [Granulosicoccus antarcticus IMCC3135]